MATRTIKLMGTAYSTTSDVNVVVNFNNVEVFSGIVSTVNAESPAQGDSTLTELASWTIDTSVTGSIPMTIAVLGGTLHFSDLFGNYSGYELQRTGVEPDVVDGAYVVTTAPENYFSVLNHNTVDTDGKTDVWFSEEDGEPQSRNVGDDENLAGEWVYVIKNGITFGCNFTIDPSLVYTQVPTPPTP